MKPNQALTLRRGGRVPGAPRSYGGTHDLALKRLAGRLLRQRLAETSNPLVHVALRHAAAEAESLAWQTPHPLWALPTLFEEKARQARLYALRQAELRDASREWLSLAE